MGERMSAETVPEKRLVLACSECGGKPRGLRYHDLPGWPDCRCGGTFSGRYGGVLYPDIIMARYDLGAEPSDA